MNYDTRPTPTKVNSFVKKYNRLYPQAEENYLAAIDMTQAFYHNKSYRNILLKVNVINGIFKTAIGDTTGLAASIHARVRQIDKRLQKGDLTLVDEIGMYHVDEGIIRNNKSFASKYCHCHYQGLFPINDQYVRKSLLEFNARFPFAEFTLQEIKADYPAFTKVLTSFKSEFGLTSLGNPLIDRLLWVLGKAARTPLV